MIARRAVVGAVCLRCRIQLLRRLAPVRYFASDASDASDATSTTDRVDDGGDGKDAGRDANRNQNHKSRTSAWPSVRRLNLRPHHVSRNRLLREGTATLGSDMLGTPAHAIVMRDGGPLRRRDRPLVSDGEAAESSGSLAASVEALLDSQREPPTVDEVRSNIHNMQPKTDKVLSHAGFRKLQSLLTAGFLRAQLEDYIEWYKLDAERKSQEATTDSSPHPEFPWIEEMRPWVPLPSQTDVTEGTDATLRGYVSKNTRSKTRLVIRMMRECWGLSMVELETQLGEAWIKLRSPEFTLLMRGTQRFMNTLSKISLDPGENIEAIQNREALRFVTTKPKADLLLRDLDETLKGVKTKAFPIALLGHQMPPPDVLELVGLVTNTEVKKSHTERREKLHVSWIEIQSRAARNLEALEDMAHIVFRLLLTALGPPQTTSTLLSPELSQAHPGRLIVDATCKDKLGWKDRVLPWARYVHPLTPKRSVVNAALPIEKFELPFEPLARPETVKEGLEFFPETDFPAHPVKWSNTGRTSTTAHFGHILHPYKPENQTPLLSDLLASTDRRVFAPSAPHPLHLTKFESNDPDSSATSVTTKSTLVLRFWPSPSSNPTRKPSSSEPLERPASKHAGDTPPAPILELRLVTSDNEVEGVESLRAITRTHHTDVMLPSSPVDVRFTQTQYEMLQAPDRETLDTWQPLANFLNPARLDLENGKLEVPPRQRFPIPRRLIATDPVSPSPPTSSSPSISADPPTAAEAEHIHSAVRWHQDDNQQFLDPHSLVSIYYEFVGLEFHRSTTLAFEDHELTYTSIEAGQGGGRRAEVTLEPREPLRSTSSTTAADKDRLQKDFLAYCSRFATNGSIWVGL